MFIIIPSFLFFMKHVDLHVHTLYSDGVDTPNQIVKTARLNGLEMIAIADHDNLRGYYEALPHAKSQALDLVPGVEITTIQHHLLGLNFNPRDEGFVKFIQHAQDIQRGVCNQRVEVLRAHGIPIPFDQVQSAYSHATSGKYSILKTMLSDRTCRDYLERKHGQLKFDELFKIYLSDSGIAGHVEKRKVVEWGEAIAEIHKAGGLAIFPHPSTKADDPSKVSDMLAGIDGIEVQPQFGEKNTPFRDYAKKEGLLVVFGSDYHDSAFNSMLRNKGDNLLDEHVFGKIKE